MNITPLDADQCTRVVRCFITFQTFSFMPGDEPEAVTRQDLTEFRTFLLEQLKSHTSELSSKFEKASTDAECALSVSKQLKSRERTQVFLPWKRKEL